MDNISNVLIKPLEKSIYMKPYTMHFTQNGTKRTWDLLTVHDSVAIVLYNNTRNVLIFVKQFRPAVYFGAIPENDRLLNSMINVEKYPASMGITLELCAGIVDKNLSLPEIAKEEILEECGYNVQLTSLERIGSFRSGVGTSGSIQTMFYCEVSDDMKVSSGGGIGDEFIEVIEMSMEDVKKFIKQDVVPSPSSFMFGIFWFLSNKLKK